MLFGKNAKKEIEVDYDGLYKHQFLTIAYEVLKKLNWDINLVSLEGIYAHTNFSWKSWSEIFIIRFLEDKVYITSECNTHQRFDFGKNKQNIELFLKTFQEIKSLYSLDEINAKYYTIDIYTEEDTSEVEEEILPLRDRILAFFIPKEGYFITPILVNLNIVIFIAMVISGVNPLLPDTESLLNWGANFKASTLDGQWWRLLTCCFIHIGIIHLAFNMYALVYIGKFVENALGKTRFLSSYLLTGIAASITSLVWNDFNVSAGASGAIFGMYGLFLALLLANYFDRKIKNALLPSIGMFVFYNVLIGLRMKEFIDNAAHLGGLLSGVIIGLAFIPSLKNNSTFLKNSTIVVLSLLVLISGVYFYQNTSNDIGKFDQMMEEFIANEKEAIDKINDQSNFLYDEQAQNTYREAITLFNANKEIIEQVNLLKLPEILTKRNILLTEYCDLRIEQFELLEKTTTNKIMMFPSTEVMALNKKIEDKLNEISNLK